MLMLIIRSIQALALLGIMVYVPVMVGYHNIRGEALTSPEAFFAGVAVMCYVGMLNRGISYGKAKR